MAELLVHPSVPAAFVWQPNGDDRLRDEGCARVGACHGARRVHMARLAYAAMTSLDGFVADQADELDRAVPDEEVHGYIDVSHRSLRA